MTNNKKIILFYFLYSCTVLPNSVFMSKVPMKVAIKYSSLNELVSYMDAL